MNVICHQIDLICHHGLTRVGVGSTYSPTRSTRVQECYSGGTGKKRFDVCLFRMTLFFPKSDGVPMIGMLIFDDILFVTN